MSNSGEVSYGSYLKLDSLLQLQQCLSEEHDELQFIIVHQAHELWFKQLLFELETIRDGMLSGEARTATRLLRRVHRILRALLAQLEVIETMRSVDFLRFRNHLQPASGFQSLQFREMEILSGLRDERYLRLHRDDPEAVARLRRRLEEPSLWDGFLAYLQRGELETGSPEALRRSLRVVEKGEALPDGPELIEALLDLDDLVAAWRMRHVRMVERMIGSRPGTGQQSVEELVSAGYSVLGAGGLGYLETTLPKRFFPLLREVRTELGD